MAIKKSLDGKCIFSSKKHTYKVGKKVLTSGTKYLKTIAEEFDADKTARFKAMLSKKRGEKGHGVKYWKDLWKATAMKGTMTHLALENEFNTSYGDTAKVDTSEYSMPLDTATANKITQGCKWLHHYMKTVGEPQGYTEYIVYDLDIEVAGQMDLLVARNEGDFTPGIVYDIIDYKTNNEIKREGYQGRMCKPPFNDLPDCEYTKYTMQLSLYAYMLEKRGCKIGNLILVHLKENSVEPMIITYEKKLIEKLIKHNEDFK